MGKPRKACKSPAQVSARKVRQKYSNLTPAKGAKFTKHAKTTKSPGRAKRALYKVEHENISLRKAAKALNISYSFLQRRASGVVEIESRNGRKPVFTKAEEEKLANYLSEMAARGMGLRTSEFLNFVGNIIKKENRTNPFTDGVPGYTWYKGFMERNKNIVEKRKETPLEASRAKVTPSLIDDWFCKYRIFISDKELLDKPERIYNADETGFTMGSKSGNVIGPTKRIHAGPVPHVSGGKSKERVTVMYCANAAGNVLPPFFVFAKPKPVSYDNLAGATKGSDAAYTDKGWMDVPTFKKFIGHLDKYGEKERPIVLLIDSVGSHVSIECFSEAKEHGIEIYRLVRNATHIMQPLDVGVYGPLKSSWYKHLRLHKRENPEDPVSKKTFARHLHSAFMDFYKPLTVIRAFSSAGIYPLQRDAISDARLKPAETYESCQQIEKVDMNVSCTCVCSVSPVAQVSEKNPASGLDLLVQAVDVLGTSQQHNRSESVSPHIQEAIKLPVIKERGKRQVRLSDKLSDHLTSDESLRVAALKSLEKVEAFARKEKTAKEKYLREINKSLKHTPKTGKYKTKKVKLSSKQVPTTSERAPATTEPVLTLNDPVPVTTEPVLTLTDPVFDTTGQVSATARQSSNAELCIICETEDPNFEQWIACDICDSWLHVQCIPAYHKWDRAALTEQSVQFICPKCV
jgi:hypothetical protein